MSIYNTYDEILQNGESEQDAIDFAMDYCFEDEPEKQSIKCATYIDTVCGVEIYYDYGADYYFFCPAE